MTEWTDAELAAVLPALRIDPSRKWKLRPFPASPRGRTEQDLEDYRRFPLGSLTRFSIRETDFSRARSQPNSRGVDTGISLASCECHRVRLDHAGRFHRLDGLFSSCTFESISTDHCGLVGFFQDCTFRGARLRGAVFAGDFRRCDFETGRGATNVPPHEEAYRGVR